MISFKKRIIQLGIIFLVLCIAIFKFFFIPLKLHLTKEHPFIVRVRLVHNANVLRLTSGGKCQIHDAKGEDLLEKGVDIHDETEISPTESGIKVGEEIFNTKWIRISFPRCEYFTLNGIVYKGQLDILRAAEGLNAVNLVGLEDYLKGVVPRETHHFWPFEAIKAQTIASRSFAVHEVMRRRSDYYDLMANTFSQIYGGQSSERWRTTRAVEVTRGKLLEYEGKVLPAYFHSSCGGHTQNISRIWGKELKPLEGVKCSWCRWSPSFRWQIRVDTRTILKRLNDKGYPLKRIDIVKGGDRDRSNRLGYVMIRSYDKWFEIKTENFLSIVGRKFLKSTNFHVKKYPLFYLFSGYGWGHGVGLCQWGMFGLSLRRWSCERILQYYYPGTKIVSLSEVIDK